MTRIERNPLRKRKILLCSAFLMLLLYFSTIVCADPALYDIKTSDVFFAYPKSLRQTEPTVKSLFDSAQNAIKSMESDGGDILALFQTVMDDPEGGAQTTLLDLIFGTDTRGEDCTYEATEELLKQIGASSDLYAFQEYCPGIYQSFYKIAKRAKDFESAVVDFSKMYIDSRYDQVKETLSAVLSDEDGFVRDLILQDNTEYRDELIAAIDKGTEGVSEAMDLLKYANKLTELIDVIILVDSVDDEMFDYLYYSLSSEELKDAIWKYKNYKSTNYISYVKEKWLQEEVLEVVSDKFKDAVKEMAGGSVGANAFYAICKVALKFGALFIGEWSGYGDADALITAYKSWNFVQELNAAVSRRISTLQFSPCTMEAIAEYEKTYNLYVSAVIAFAKSAQKANSNAASSINMWLNKVDAMRDASPNEKSGLFYAQVEYCKLLLQSEENRDFYYRKVSDTEQLYYSCEGKDVVYIEPSSDDMKDDTIYTAPDGNIFYGIDLCKCQLVVTCEASTPGSIYTGCENYGLTIEKDSVLHIGGNFQAGYYYNGSIYTGSFMSDRKIYIYGALKCDGSMKGMYSTLILSGDEVKLEVDGDAQFGACEIDSGKMIFNGGLDAPIGNMGTATIVLNTPAEKAVEMKYLKLNTVSDEDVEKTSANITLIQKKKAEDGLQPEYELAGSAAAHQLFITGVYRQTGDACYHSIQLAKSGDDIGRCVIVGNTEVVGDITTYNEQYELKVERGAVLHIGGNFHAGYYYNGSIYSGSFMSDRKIYVYGAMKCDGSMKGMYSTLILSGDEGKLEVDGDAKFDDCEIDSGELIFNGGLDAPIGNMGTATIVLNTPAEKAVEMKYLKLNTVSDEDVEKTSANITLIQKKKAEDGLQPEYELAGDAVAHQLEIAAVYRQIGDACYHSIYLRNGGGDIGRYVITGNTEVVGDITTYCEQYGLKVEKGAVLHVRGNFNGRSYPNGNISTDYFISDRKIEVYGSLKCDGDIIDMYSTLILSGDEAKLEVDGNAQFGPSEIDSGYLIFNGNVNAQIGNIGTATVALNTPADFEAVLKYLKLGWVSCEDTEQTSANLILTQKEPVSEETKGSFELRGSAPGHELYLYALHTQIGDAKYHSLGLGPSTGYNITGNVEIEESVYADPFEYSLVVEPDAILRVGKDFKDGNNSYPSEYYPERNIEVYGNLYVSGDFILNDSHLTVSGKSPKVEVGGDALMCGLLVSGESPKIKVDGDAVVSRTKIEDGELVFGGSIISDIDDIGSAVITVTGNRVGPVYLPGIYMERNGSTPNLKVYKENDIYQIMPLEKNLKVSATMMKLYDIQYALLDGTYEIDTVTQLSGFLDLNHNLQILGNLELKGDSAIQNSEESVISVSGDFTTSLSEGTFSGGTLLVAGNYIQSGYKSFIETGTHKTIFNGLTKQTVNLGHPESHFNIVEIANKSEEGVVFANDTFFDQLFDHQRNHFTLTYDEDDRFADYDQDGVKDHRDPYPTDPNKSYIGFQVFPISDQTYTGGALTPVITVKDDEGAILQEGKDYEVFYTDNISPGTAKVTVNGKGFHSMNVEASFAIIYENEYYEHDFCEHDFSEGWLYYEPEEGEYFGKWYKTCSICGLEYMEELIEKPQLIGKSGMSLAELRLIDGEVIGNGEPINGEWKLCGEDTSVVPEADVEYTLEFIPDDTEWAAFQVEVFPQLSEDSLAVELAKAKAEARNTVNSVELSDYIESDQEKLSGAKDAAISEIDEATTIEAVAEALLAFNDVLGNCKTKEQQEAEDPAAADQVAAEAVIAWISAIGDVAFTDEGKAKLDAARKAYDELTEAQQALVSNYETLTQAETKYAELMAEVEQSATDHSAAEAVSAKIAAIGEVSYTDASKAKIDAARAAYDKLTAAQQGLVSNYAVLTNAEEKYVEQKKAAESESGNEPKNGNSSGVDSKPSGDDRSGESENQASPDTTPSSGTQTAETVANEVKEPITINKVPTSVKVKTDKNKVTVSWKKIKKNKSGKKLLKKIKSIQVQYSTDPQFKQKPVKRKVSKSKTKITLKLKRKKTYYIRARYVTKDGFSKWSKVKRVRTK